MPYLLFRNFIPTYSKDCEHIFCLSCILRWVIKKNNCLLRRKSIKQIGYLASESKKSTIIINVGDLKIDINDHINDSKDSRICIICKKSEPCNKLIPCLKCKYNLTHITCGNIEISNLHNFVCFKCGYE